MKKLKTWVKKAKEEDRELVERLRETEFEKGDLKAIVIAALVTLLPAVIGVLLIFGIIIILFTNL